MSLNRFIAIKGLKVLSPLWLLGDHSSDGKHYLSEGLALPYVYVKKQVRHGASNAQHLKVSVFNVFTNAFG
jgi:hypothetical protein